MNIIIYVDFNNSQINKDFQLGNVLLESHTVLLASSQEQVMSAINSYSHIMLGYSRQNDIAREFINQICNINNKEKLDIKNLQLLK